MKKVNLILASGSPRRRELLQKVGVPFTVMESGYDEPDPQGQKAEKYAIEMAKGKVRAVQEKVGKKDAVILGVDTLGVLGKEILGKPHTPFEAKKFLRKLSGKTHKAISGVVMRDALNGKEYEEVVTTEVTFRELGLGEIDKYVQTGEPLDAAAGYKIQSGAALFVREIKGDFYNVMGLPVFRVAEMLRENFGVVWGEMLE